MSVFALMPSKAGPCPKMALKSDLDIRFVSDEHRDVAAYVSRDAGKQVHVERDYGGLAAGPGGSPAQTPGSR
jgi:hypothetical protein